MNADVVKKGLPAVFYIGVISTLLRDAKEDLDFLHAKHLLH